MNKISNAKLQTPVSHHLRSALISVAGKIIHLFLSKRNKSLEKTSQQYLEKTHTEIKMGNNSKQAIQDLKDEGKGIIISNHSSGVFSDYLPLFAMLGDEILKKCVFYTGAYNLAMNQREFPEYQFRAATLVTREDSTTLKEHITNDVKKINEKGGYIFIIPSGESTDKDAEFQSIFQKMIKNAENDLPILINTINHENLEGETTPKGYKEILLNILLGKGGVANICAKLTKAENWKELNGKAMREQYNKLHSN